MYQNWRSNDSSSLGGGQSENMKLFAQPTCPTKSFFKFFTMKTFDSDFSMMANLVRLIKWRKIQRSEPLRRTWFTIWFFELAQPRFLGKFGKRVLELVNMNLEVRVIVGKTLMILIWRPNINNLVETWLSDVYVMKTNSELCPTRLCDTVWVTLPD